MNRLCARLGVMLVFISIVAAQLAIIYGHIMLYQ